MMHIENQCVGCPPEMGCLGSSCPNRNVQVFYCDECGEDFAPHDLYRYDDQDLCEVCLLQKFTKVEDIIG